MDESQARRAEQDNKRRAMAEALMRVNQQSANDGAGAFGANGNTSNYGAMGSAGSILAGGLQGYIDGKRLQEAGFDFNPYMNGNAVNSTRNSWDGATGMGANTMVGGGGFGMGGGGGGMGMFNVGAGSAGGMSSGVTDMGWMSGIGVGA